MRLGTTGTTGQSCQESGIGVVVGVGSWVAIMDGGWDAMTRNSLAVGASIDGWRVGVEDAFVVLGFPSTQEGSKHSRVRAGRRRFMRDPPDSASIETQPPGDS